MIPFELCKGPKDAKVMVVGEAPGAEEELKRLPFVGTSGRFLHALLKGAGFDPKELFFTNVLTIRPPNNKIEALCVPKKDLPVDYDLPPLGSGKYLKPELVCHLDRLAEEIRQVKPNIIIGLGATASWALIQSPKIKDARGAWHNERLSGLGVKTIFSWHPAAVLRQWKLKIDLQLDLLKAYKGKDSPDIERTVRELLLNPTLDELNEVKPRLLSADYLVCDIETYRGQIDCIGFSPDPSFAVSVPFFQTFGSHKNHWTSTSAEVQAWLWVREVLTSDVPKVFQNGLFDLSWLIHKYKIPVRNAGEDTMLLAHALHPERPKGLADLAAIYANELPWKFNYRRREDEKED